MTNKKAYLVEKSIFEYDDWYEMNTFVCETKELAESMIDQLRQEAADEFMDFIDEMRAYSNNDIDFVKYMVSYECTKDYKFIVMEVNYYGP